MAALSIQERKRLRQIGHALNPVVMIGGQGLTEGVIEETNRALNDHELIKIKIAGEDRDTRAQVIDALIAETQAEVVQKIGKIALLYKKAAKQNPNLSNLVRHAHLGNK
ncbi:ribosome assembly RNA-binding protein YhbY [Acinetobacter soli]|uniref:ribosome assembly RNA-binding protein YhbY n=1 Tax=Acinetobacter TaxID=469 RepID=UPI0006611504|nr:MULTISPECIES: ribosome assembly RNA-binding protein YhbY [Acinetobacter]KOR14397.1 RNA-binding protein [Acinetobacter sp. C15]MBO3639411.1 ribosome assembly RNA-binding protein YhbY [Acinetobacter soli]MCE6009205.1 ribosome assembly RNA-binding protein YhbY [Acinetobacter soli]